MVKGKITKSPNSLFPSQVLPCAQTGRETDSRELIQSLKKSTPEHFSTLLLH